MTSFRFKVLKIQDWKAMEHSGAGKTTGPGEKAKSRRTSNGSTAFRQILSFLQPRCLFRHSASPAISIVRSSSPRSSRCDDRCRHERITSVSNTSTRRQISRPLHGPTSQHHCQFDLCLMPFSRSLHSSHPSRLSDDVAMTTAAAFVTTWLYDCTCRIDVRVYSR